MLAASAALVASLALQAGVTRYDAGLYALTRYARGPNALDAMSYTLVELGPSAGLDHQERTLDLAIAYLPRLTMIVGRASPQILNRASLKLALQPSQGLAVTGDASACYGTYDFRLPSQGSCAVAGGTGTSLIESGWSGSPGTGGAGAGAGGTGGPVIGQVEPVPQLATATYTSGLAGLGFESTVSRSIGVTGRMSYLVQGGADASTRRVLPLQRGPRLSAALDWAPSWADVLSTSLVGAYYTFLGGAAVAGNSAPLQDAWLAHLVEAWRHRTGPQGVLRLALGIGITGNAVELSRLVVRRVSPGAEVSYHQGLGQPAVELGLGVRVVPFVDFTSGLSYDRGESTASLRWPLSRYLRGDVDFSAAAALDGIQRGQVTGAGQLAANWAAARWAEIFVGLGGQWQRAGPDFPTATYRQWSIFLGGRMRDAGRF